VAILAALIMWMRATRATNEAPVAPPSVTVAIAKRGTFTVRVDAQGRIGAPAGSTSDLSFAVAGTIASIDVRVGDRVTAGQPLARVQTLYAGGIAAAKDVEAARSQLAADEADARALHARTGAGSTNGVLAQARADYAQAVADLRTAQAQVGNLAGQAERANGAL